MLQDFDLQALYTAIDEQRRSRCLTWAAVSREVNSMAADVPGRKPIATSTIAGLRVKALGEGDGILQMLLWLGRTPESFVPGADIPRHLGKLRELGTSQILRWNTKALHAALDAKRTCGGLSWNEVAIRIGGVNARGLARMAKGGRTHFPLVMRITKWLGKPAAHFTRASDW